MRRKQTLRAALCAALLALLAAFAPPKAFASPTLPDLAGIAAAVRDTLTEAVSAAAEAPLEAEPVEVGSVLTLGAWEQDGDETNGPEPIEWLVLKTEPGRALVLSRYGLFAAGYHDVNVKVTWEDCALRATLNGAFFDAAFGGAERGRILTVTVPPAESIRSKRVLGSATEDRLFLLSIAELDELLPTDAERECRPTAWALAHGAQAKEANGNGWWWLRSPGGGSDFAPRINCYGSLRAYTPVTSWYSCARPAMWIETTD